MEKPKFIYVTHVNTSPEKLWAALTKPEFTRQYWNYDIESDWKPGSPVKLIRAGEKPKLNGVVLRYEPPRVLSYTFVPGCKQTELPPEKSSVTFEITVEFGVTKLTVTHEFQPDTKFLGETSQGWQCIISSLKSLLETGHALPFVWKS